MVRQANAKKADLVTLRVELLELSPAVWRTLRVRADTRLSKLHRILQAAMGWSDSHLHEFIVAGQRYGVLDPDGEANPPRNEKVVRLLDLGLRAGDSLVYVYDFGDEWVHRVTVEGVEPGEDETVRAVCLAGERNCPPEDCGGPPGYAELLEALADPRHPEHKAMRRWVGGRFDPEAFDRDEINARLTAIH